MKLWLNDILACPEDKHFPLKLYIFEWNQDQRKVDFTAIIKDYNENTLRPDIPEGLIEIIPDNATGIKIKDMIVIKPSDPKTYLSSLIKSIDELECVTDLAQGEKTNSTEMIKLVRGSIKEKFTQILSKIDSTPSSELNGIFDELFPTMGLVNILKVLMEIEKGILICEKCNRWFPIFDSIPQMLPDKFRVKEIDEKFKNEYIKILPKTLTEKLGER